MENFHFYDISIPENVIRSVDNKDMAANASKMTLHLI
jgi:hypothetical protein